MADYEGIHYGLADAAYRTIPAVSNSILSRFAAATPKHFKESAEFKGSPESELGAAVHSLYLTPELFRLKYVQGQKLDRRTKDGKEAHALFLAMNEGKQVLPYYDYQRCEAIVRELGTHAELRKLSVNGAPEVSIFWQDNLTHFPCKGRLDLYDQATARVLDLKTTGKLATEREFARTVVQRGYHRQAAFYLDGLRAIGAPAKDFYFIVVETEAPYAVALFKIDEAFIEIGRQQIRGLLSQYAICQNSDYWPAYPTEVQMLRCPPWLKPEGGIQITQLEDY